MILNKPLAACYVALLLSSSLPGATIKENTYVWTAADHSGWKGMTNYPLGYVIAGNKFFEPNNTVIYITGFNELSQHIWTMAHPTTQLGFSSLDTFWKSFTNIGPASNPNGFFIAGSGTRNGSKAYYTLRVDKTGQRTGERSGPLPEGITFGGACQAENGGFIAVGGNNSGQLAVVKFNPAGEFQWHTILPFSAFGWTVQQTPNGGYVLGGTGHRAIRIDANGNFVGAATANLPTSPDGSAYTYSEFEEIVPLQDGMGFVMTGSTFSNSTSSVYTARFDWSDQVVWAKVNDSSNTALSGTPVSWANSAVEKENTGTGVREILFTWRRGPVSSGGTLFFERMNPADGSELQKASLGNTTPVQEAFTIYQPFVDRITIAGTRGGYSAVYSYNADSLP